jgi:hypothetical protein
MHFHNGHPDGELKKVLDSHIRAIDGSLDNGDRSLWVRVVALQIIEFGGTLCKYNIDTSEAVDWLRAGMCNSRIGTRLNDRQIDELIDDAFDHIIDKTKIVDGITDPVLPPPSKDPKPKVPPEQKTEPDKAAVSLDDFLAFMPMHNYIFAPTGEPWPAQSVNSRIPPVTIVDASGCPIVGNDGKQKTVKPSAWLDQNRPVEQMTWAPGEPKLIRDRLISDGGWFPRKGATVFNLYRPGAMEPGDPQGADTWIDHVHHVYGASANHIIQWLACRVQKPQEKVNHAIVLGGKQGIGKDTLLEPVKHAIGPWNFAEVSPHHILGRFNSFLQSIILRVNEARDLGDVNRYQLYDHMKAYTAAPPDVLRVDQKNLREYAIFNVTGVIITTNHKTDGIFLPPDDRRHYVVWSELDKEDFTPAYWQEIWSWYEDGGIWDVAAYLKALDISGFDAKAPPPKTDAFWEIVDADRSAEEAELSDILERLNSPAAITIDRVVGEAEYKLVAWLNERRNRRVIPLKMESAGYVPVRNESARDGLWKVDGKRKVVYARSELTLRDRLVAVKELVSSANKGAVN